MHTEVEMGQVAVLQGTGTLTALGVSSCVIIMIFDRVHRVAAMAHAMLPGSLAPSHNGHGIPDTEHVDAAIDAVIAHLLAQGADRQCLTAKIVGGANMFATLRQDIPKQNIVAAKTKLKAEKIPLIGEMVGGHIGRSVEFDVATGDVTVKSKF
jgi:chemotaxis protein CheD